MATPKLQNAYRNSSTQTDDIADLLLITTTGLATNADAGASFIVFNDGANDVLLSSATPLPVVAAATDVLLGTIDADTGAIATSAASIDTKTPALGQALAAASVPVVLTAAQISTLTPPAAITGFATESTLGTLSAKFASGTVIGDVNLGATDNAVLDAIAASVAGTLTVGSHAVTNAGTFAVQAAQSGTWNVTNISGTVSLPTGASTAAKQPALGTAGTASADVITVQGITSMTALKVDGSAVTQPVSGTFWQATQPVSLASVPSHAVTNAGTFAVQVSSALPAGTNNIGDVDVLSLPALPTGTNSIGQVTANAGTNLNTSALALESGGNLAAIRAGVAAPEGSPGSNVFVMGAYDAGDSGFIKNLQCSINGELYIAASNPLATRATGSTAHDVALSDNPVAIGGYASAAAPTSVSADGDVTYVWCLRNGSPVVNLAVGGTLVTGSAGLPVDGNIADDAAFTPATTRVLMAGYFADETSTDSVNEGDGGAARMTLDRKVIVNPQPHTAGGLSIFRSLDLDETEEEVKATAGQLYGGFVTNTSTGTRWIKFYNATAASVTVGSTTPVITWGIQGGATDDVAAVLNLGGMGVGFTTAITVAATTGVADADTGAPGSGDIVINLFFK